MKLITATYKDDAVNTELRDIDLKKGENNPTCVVNLYSKFKYQSFLSFG